MMGCLLLTATRLLPPYHKHGIFAFCGLELLYSSVVMAINQKFWDLSSKIMPVSFRMFNDTVYKGEPADFRWTSAEYRQLQWYQEKLATMWLSSTLVILFSMLCIVPQFCTTENAKGREVTYCVKRPAIGWIMAPVLVFLIVVMGALLTWQWLTCEADAELFYSLFRAAQKEEQFLTLFERQLNCILDDDKEIGSYWKCDNTIDRSIINRSWLDPLLYAFIACHILMVAGLAIFNRDFDSDREESSNTLAKHIGSGTDGSEALISA